MSSFFKKLFGIKSEAAATDEKSAELREDSIQLHLDRMTNQLVSFVTGVKENGDQLISDIALACRQVNDHWVVANVDRKQKKEPAAFRQADIQKVMYCGCT